MKLLLRILRSTALVFARGKGWQKNGGHRGLWLVEAEGESKPCCVIQGELSWEAPCSWRPDGRALIYADKHGQLWELLLGGLRGQEGVR